jgi:hypothetical protein
MAGYADKLQKKASEVLRSGERLIAAVRTMPRGTTIGTGVGGLIGATIAQRQAAKSQATSGPLATAWPKGNSAVGLTDQRLLIFNHTAMGKPKDLRRRVLARSGGVHRAREEEGHGQLPARRFRGRLGGPGRVRQDGEGR